MYNRPQFLHMRAKLGQLFLADVLRVTTFT